ncbi:hypothetical protein M885DRAFT_423940, partial [Pelagophyceae sp. CCMP2097]
RLFDMFDTNADGKIFIDEMAELLMNLTGGDVRQRMQLIFNLYDRDRSGSISRDELGKML